MTLLYSSLLLSLVPQCYKYLLLVFHVQPACRTSTPLWHYLSTIPMNPIFFASQVHHLCVPCNRSALVCTEHTTIKHASCRKGPQSQPYSLFMKSKRSQKLLQPRCHHITWVWEWFIYAWESIWLYWTETPHEAALQSQSPWGKLPLPWLQSQSFRKDVHFSSWAWNVKLFKSHYRVF